MYCQFEVAGEPRGKARPRAGRYSVYDPPQNREWEKMIRDAFLEARGMIDPTDEPVWIVVTAFFPIPQWAKRKKLPDKIQIGDVYVGKPDCDNILKSVMDALNKVAYLDDKQIFSAQCVRFYGERPRISVTISTRIIPEVLI